MHEAGANVWVGQFMLFFFMIVFIIAIALLFIGKNAKEKYQNYARLPLDSDVDDQQKDNNKE